jgi:hypothetical protein
MWLYGRMVWGDGGIFVSGWFRGWYRVLRLEVLGMMYHGIKIEVDACSRSKVFQDALLGVGRITSGDIMQQDAAQPMKAPWSSCKNEDASA